MSTFSSEDLVSINPELALGTVQFGCEYGIANNSIRVSEDEAKSILAAAYDLGIRVLDTAASYGDIEHRLIRLIPSGADFKIVSKLPPILPERLEDKSESFLKRYVRELIDISASRLEKHLTTILFHRAEDLAGVDGSLIWGTAWERTRQLGLRLGVSIYDSGDLRFEVAGRPVEVVQCAANVFDQRLLEMHKLECWPREVHIRSTFLQGLLLMNTEDVARKLPAALQAHRRWIEWCVHKDIRPISAALGFVKSLPARYCVLGVNSKAQLEQVVHEWNSAAPVRIPSLSLQEKEIIDPRTWNASN